MEYICLILQIIFLLGTIFLPTNDRYLVNYTGYYKKYLIVELIVQGLFLITNGVIIFLIKEIMTCILAMDVVLMALILIFYSRKAKKEYFNELINIIKENDLLLVDSKEIKDYLLEKCERVCFVEDIEKCLLKINNTRNFDVKLKRLK